MKENMTYRRIEVFNSTTHQLQHVLCLPAQEPRVVGLLVADGPEELVLVAAVEGRLPDHHLVEEDAERPPVDAVGVLQALYDLPFGESIQSRFMPPLI